jgi:hypothetical protein
MEDATASSICPDLPGAASSAVVPSSAIPTATLSASAIISGHSVLPPGTPAVVGTIVTTTSSMHLGNSAAPTASGVSATGAEGASPIPTPDGPVAEGPSASRPPHVGDHTHTPGS